MLTLQDATGLPGGRSGQLLLLAGVGLGDLDSFWAPRWVPNVSQMADRGLRGLRSGAFDTFWAPTCLPGASQMDPRGLLGIRSPLGRLPDGPQRPLRPQIASWPPLQVASGFPCVHRWLTDGPQMASRCLPEGSQMAALGGSVCIATTTTTATTATTTPRASL